MVNITPTVLPAVSDAVRVEPAVSEAVSVVPAVNDATRELPTASDAVIVVLANSTRRPDVAETGAMAAELAPAICIRSR